MLYSAVIALALFTEFDSTADAGAIHEYAERGDLAGVEQELNNNVNVNSQDKWGFTALMWAIQNGDINITEKLLQHPDIDVNIQNNVKSTALIKAAFFNQKNILEKLLQAGADVSLKNNSDKTALDLAEDPEIKQLIQTHIQCLENRCRTTKSAANRAS